MWGNEENDPDDRYLFKGSSCYPLSPDKQKKGPNGTKIDI